MNRRHTVPILAMLAALGLAGCNSGAAPPELAANASVTPGDFNPPEGAGCSGAVARYRAITDNDLAMGHVNRRVYDQIQGEISEVAAACSAGRDARAIALLHASKARHGYPG